MIRRILAGIIRIYQWCFSWWLGRCCRFHPSCSEYTRQSILLHGPVPGIWLGMKRICRCHPFHPGGHDPVPPARQGRANLKSQISHFRPEESPAFNDSRFTIHASRGRHG